jgi:dolichol-phosphate mannosyltransferase
MNRPQPGAGGTEAGRGVMVVVPTYNEAENITALVEQILENAPEAHVLVVDDGSPDGTAALVETMAASDDRVAVLKRTAKLGLGTAYMAGFERALSEGYAFVQTMDADFSHHPRYLPSILAAAKLPGVDMVIGSRYVHGGRVEGWGLHRRLLSKGANTFARLVLGLRPHDCTGAYRCYSARILTELDFGTVRSHGYSALVELLWHFRGAGHHVQEVPITFVDRELGVSKISRSEITKGVSTVMQLRFRRRPAARRLGERPGI